MEYYQVSRVDCNGCSTIEIGKFKNNEDAEKAARGFGYGDFAYGNISHIEGYIYESFDEFLTNNPHFVAHYASFEQRAKERIAKILASLTPYERSLLGTH